MPSRARQSEACLACSPPISGANLTDADVSGADLRGADFSEAHQRGLATSEAKTGSIPGLGLSTKGPQELGVAEDDIYAWLAEASLRSTPLKELLTGFCTELDASGLNIDRVTIATAALDPSIRAQSLTWERGGEAYLATLPARRIQPSPGSRARWR